MAVVDSRDYPAQYESRFLLRNGKEVFVRPVMETDGPFLLDLFRKISPESLYFRFLRRLPDLPDNMLRHFTHVDYSSEFALVAMIPEEGQDTVIAAARYAFDPDDALTDLAIAVRDDWQRVGLGKILLGRIVAIGKEHGIDRFSGMMDPQNRIIQKILTDLGYDVTYFSKGGFFQVEILV